MRLNMQKKTKNFSFKGPYQCYYMSLCFVIISHIGYINHFPQNSFIYDWRYRVCLHFAHIQQMLQKVPENV